MKNSIIIIISLLFLEFCNIQKSNVDRLLSVTEEEIGQIDSLIPKFIDSKNYISIYRFGSIFLSSNPGAAFCIKKTDIHKSVIPFKYISFNEMFLCEGKLFTYKSSDVQIQMFSLEFENRKYKSFQINQFSQFNNIKMLKNLNLKSESFCGNIYIIANNDRYFLMNASNRISDSYKLLVSLMESVSQLERIQCLTLRKDCDHRDLNQMDEILEDSSIAYSLNWDVYRNYFAVDIDKYIADLKKK